MGHVIDIPEVDNMGQASVKLYEHSTGDTSV